MQKTLSPLKECAKVFGAALLVFIIVLFFGWFLAPAVNTELPEFDQEAIAEAQQLRDVSFSPDDKFVHFVDVDYTEGPEAEWYPKNSSPLLKPLEESGDLPPVAERTGPEPLVLTSTEGVANYGGSWLMNVGSQWDMIRIRDVYGAATLVRPSVFVYPYTPHVAKSWTVSEDMREFVFHLRKGMRWSDGHPFTADDILFWWEYEALRPKVGIHTEVPRFMVTRGVEGNVEKIDDYTVRFSFKHSNGLFIEFLASAGGNYLTNCPKHYLEKFHPDIGDQELIQKAIRAFNLKSARELYDRIREPVNAEHPRLWPWIYRTYKANPPQTFVRNPYYFAVDTNGNQLPYIDQHIWNVQAPDFISQSAASGQVTYQSMFLRFENYSLFMDNREKFDYQLYHHYPTNSSSFLLNPNLNRRVDPEIPETRWKHQYLNRKEFRIALSHAINRKPIIESEYLGLSEPAQAGPDKESPYYYPGLREAYTGFDPDLANKMLDELELDNYDAEGYRTFPDGTRMQFFISAVRSQPASTIQLIIEDWARVGIRASLRQKQRALFYAELEGLQHDFSVWGSGNEFLAPMDTRTFVPSQWDSDYARAWAKWYTRGGLFGDERADSLDTPPPPKDHPLYRAMVLLEETREATTREESVRIFSEILKIAKENLWTISVGTNTPALTISKNELRNVPLKAVNSWSFQSPGNMGIETYSFDNPSNSDGAIANMQKELRELTPWPQLAGINAEMNGESTGPGLGQLIQWLFIIIFIGLGVMIAIRHPFVGRRLVILVPTLVIISIVAFVTIQLPPGNFLASEIIRLQESGSEVDLETIEELRSQFRLDESVFSQYLWWMGLKWFVTYDPGDEGLLQGYMGKSMETRESVNQIVGDRVLLTLLVSVGTIIFTWLTAVPIGIYSAVRQYSIGDYAATLIGMIGMCIPSFLLAVIINYISYEYFDFSVTGLFSEEYAKQPEWTMGKVADLMAHIWVPVVILGVGGTAGLIRVMRGNLLDELKKPYVVTARAKGVRPLKLLMKYPVRLALNPFISGIGGLFPQLISGGAIVAMVLSLPTVGPLLLDSLMAEDLYMAGSLLMVLSLLGVFGTLISDLLLLAIDPRIRMEGGSR